MANDQHTAYHDSASGATSTVTPLTQQLYDAVYYSRYPTPEAEAMQAYDEACVATIEAEEVYEGLLADNTYFRQYQPGCVDFHSLIVLDQAQRVAQARATERAAAQRLREVRDALRDGRL